MPSPLSFRKAPKMSKLRLPLALLVAVVLLNVYFHSMPVHDVTTTPTLAPLEGLPATTPSQITLKPRVVDDTLRDVDPTEAEVDDLALDAGQPLVLPVMENVKLFEGVSSSPIGMTVDGPEELMDRTLLERLCTGSKDDSNNIGDLLPSEKSRQVARYLRMSPKSTGALQTLRDLFESTTERIERKLRFLLVIIAVRSRKRIDVAASVKEWQEHCDSIEDFSLHRSVHARPHLVCLFSVVFPQEYSNKTVQHFTTLFADDDAVHIVQTDVPLSQGILRMQQSGFERSAPYFTRKIGSRTDIDYTFLTSVQMLPIRPQPGVSFFTELLRLYEDASDVVDVMARRIAGGASTRGPLLGCTSVIDEFIPSTTGSLHHYQGNKVVIDQGFDFLFGNGGGGTLLNSLYAVRRHAGLTLHDDRVSGLFRDSTEAVLQSQSSVNASLLPRGVESVHAISPYCALMSERVFRMLSGIPKLGGPAPKVSRSGLRGVDGSTSNSDYAVQSPLEDYEDAVSTGRHMDRNNKTVIQRFVDLLHTPKQAHVRGEDAGEAKQRLVDVLAVRLSQLDRLRSTIRFADVMSGTPPFKRLVSFFIRYLDESVRFFDKSSPTPFTKLPTDLQVLISRLPKEHARIEESHDLAIRMQAKNVDRLSASLVFASRAVEALGRWHKTDQAKTVRQSSNNIIQEEAFMWDLCLRARAHQYPTLISNLTVRIQQHEYLEGAALVAASVDDAHIRISPIYQAYFQRAIMHVSSRITGPFQKEWEPSIIEMGIHPSFHQHPRLQVVWYTHCCHCCGFTNELQSLIYPLQRYVNVHLTAGPDCFCDNASRTLHDTFERLHSHPQNIKRYNSDDVVVYISHTNPTLFHLHREVTHASHDYLVGRSMYEFSRINAEHIEIANRMSDEIWVPAQFVYHSYLSSGADREKLVIVPEAIDTHTFNPRTAGKIDMPPTNMFYMCNRRVTQATAKESYTFLSDFKWEPRKGWDVLFEAYFRSFTAADSVILFVHTHIWFSGGPETYGWAHNITWMMEDLEHHMRTKTTLYDNKNITVENHPTYCFISQSISVNEMVALYNSVDAFVYTTRGEGWGLPAMQAMSMGLPVIGTNFGGVTEFMKPHNCFLVPLDGVVEIPFDSVYGWSYGTKWAEPSVKEAGRLMRYLASHPDHGARVGAVARQYIVEHFSEEALGKILNDRLQRIREKVLARRSENEMRQQLKP